ncbi:Helix-turn-helix domain-containing protein [Actinokineospora alba]|uniref:Helix-turn-helix domain-containing protein n=1 Tax=Actinokineospora alba TaxID=504798 RepID=A0A1H0LAI7_9PSEU|nr:helix-turn-helix transcriptional regulator [Actinokineospora alba]TDP67247.1 helix-turn-helix protein [Actinokineospora alba]SDJ02884.1 Helix-turn-helix domain-containing protein [Actinokineospora alba]SDO64960.1 Helix-turn-helix domain-containing protein [Actinokineospora alba]
MGTRREALATRREAVGFTQEGLADAVGVEFSTVGRWERGVLTPQPWRRPRIAKALAVSLDELDVLLGQVPDEAQPNLSTGPGARGRAIESSLALRSSASVMPAYDPTVHIDMGANPAEFLEPLTLHVQPPRRIGRAEVDQIKLMTGTLAASENLYGGGMAGEAGLAHLRWAGRLLSAQASTAVEAGMFEAVGNLAGVVAFSAFDVGNHDTAARCFRFGLWCAEQGASWELRAATLADMARQAIYLGNLDEALSLIEFAQVRADRLTATARAMIGVVRARLLALLGRHDEARADIDRADMHFAQRQAPTDPPWLVYYDEAEHAGSSARALTPLAVASKRPGDAAERLATAIRLHSDDYPRSRTFSKTRLATLHMTIGDPREAVDIGLQAIADAATLHSRRMDEELSKLMRACEVHRSISDVAELSHFVASAMSNV